MDIHDQAVRIGQQERGVFAYRGHFQHYARHARLILSHPDPLQKTIFHIERFAHQLGRQFGAVQVEEYAVR